MIDFSIIIPAYNLENCIEKTLESICMNSLDNAEIIVVNDGSKDNTAKVAEDFLQYSHVPHFQLLSQINKGVSAARNAGIEMAQGQYLIFCDGDDLCAENMIETIGVCRDIDCDMLVWRYDVLQGAKRRTVQKEFAEKNYTNAEALKRFLFGDNKIRLGSFAVKKSLLSERGIRFTEGCAIAEDVEFIYKCLAVSREVRTMDDILYTYIKREGSAMNQFDWKHFQAPLAIQRVYAYVKENTGLFEDTELEDYLKNGLYLLHSMFSFESFMQYLHTWRDAKEFLRQYMEEYAVIENELKRIAKCMKRRPAVFSRMRTELFCVSRQIYVYYNVVRAGKKDNR